ncbi:hypothetical protein FACS1894166_03380 [Bacilli bacterium]|nr:hypothetical protein FACS1894166_03380 [Bacilli bacterium]
MLGQRIVTEEQNGDKRASYGSKLIKELSEKLIPEFGSGLSERNLYRSIVFYKTYKILPPPGAKLN